MGGTAVAEGLRQIRTTATSPGHSALGTDRASSYADEEAVKREIAYARRMFADNGWPVIDVTRRSIEESAAAIIKLVEDRRGAAGEA